MPHLLPLLLALWLAPEPDPPLSDLDRFPADHALDETRAFQSAHLAWLEGQVGMGGWLQDEWTARLWEARRLAAPWDALHCARLDCWDPDYRRRLLGDLRRLLGPDAYREGQMSPPAAYWTFKRGD